MMQTAKWMNAGSASSKDALYNKNEAIIVNEVLQEGNANNILNQ